MRALTIRQPWLHAITDLDKRVENRTWRPPYSILGQRIALHAGLTADPPGIGWIYRISGKIVTERLDYGAIVATAVVIGWVDSSGEGEIHHPALSYIKDNKWFTGPIGWILDNIVKLQEPVSCRGQLGLWKIPEWIWIR